MIGKNTAVKVTIAAVLALGVAFCMVAQQPGTGVQNPGKQQGGNAAPTRPGSPVIRQSANRGARAGPQFSYVGP